MKALIFPSTGIVCAMIQALDRQVSAVDDHPRDDVCIWLNEWDDHEEEFPVALHVERMVLRMVGGAKTGKLELYVKHRGARVLFARGSGADEKLKRVLLLELTKYPTPEEQEAEVPAEVQRLRVSHSIDVAHFEQVGEELARAVMDFVLHDRLFAAGSAEHISLVTEH